jgi:hypothetical protein
MDPQLQALYARVKAREISPEEAAEQFKWWKARHQQGSERREEPVRETPKESTAIAGSDLLETALAALIQAALTPTTSQTEVSIDADRAVSDQFRDGAIHYFKQVLSTSLRIPLQSLDAHASVEKYGITSGLVVELTSQLEKIFGLLPKTLFFEYRESRGVNGIFPGTPWGET